MSIQIKKFLFFVISLVIGYYAAILILKILFEVFELRGYDGAFVIISAGPLFGIVSSVFCYKALVKTLQSNDNLGVSKSSTTYTKMLLHYLLALLMVFPMSYVVFMVLLSIL